MSNWTQVTAPNLATVDYPGSCGRFVFRAFGSQNGWGFNTAIDAWNGQAKKHPGERPPIGVSVPIWFDWWGTVNGVYRNWGHVAISLGDGRVLSSPVSPTPNTERQDILPSIDALMSALGGNIRYLGWNEQMDGTVVVRPVALEPHQRQVGPNSQANRRTEPTTQSALKEPALDAGTIGNFDGWITGESVNGNPIWFRGTSGDWFWSGSFTSQGIDGLKDLNPAPQPGTGERVVNPGSPVNIRTMPTTVSEIRGFIEAGKTITPDGWVTGEAVYDVDAWFKVSGGYAWAGAFTDSSTNGLTDLNGVIPEPEPEPERPDFEMFTAFSPVVTEVRPAHTANYELGRFSANQEEVVLHDFGTDGKDTFEGTMAWARNPSSQMSPHFVVSGDNIVQMVSLSNRAWHAGPGGNDRIGIELDPAVGRSPGDPLRDKTIDSARRLLIALGDNYGRKMGLRKHPEFAPTQCGDDVNLAAYDVPEPGDPVNPEPDMNHIVRELANINSTLREAFRLT